MRYYHLSEHGNNVPDLKIDYYKIVALRVKFAVFPGIVNSKTRTSLNGTMRDISTLLTRTIILVVLAILQGGRSNLQDSLGNPMRSDYEDVSADNIVAIENVQPLVIHTGPYFDKVAIKNVTALVGKTTHISCRIRNVGNRTVSWIRHRDLHLLTVDRSTYTSDQRFTSIHNPMTEEWTLQVRYPQRKDTGLYECQVGTTPPIGLVTHLSVVEPITILLGEPEMYINKGSTMNLTCIVKHSPEPPPSIYWMHNQADINYDSPRGGVSVITEKGDITVSYLLIQRAKDTDSGKYTCNPSNANPKTVIVHVLNGEHPAAMQHGGQLRLEYPLFACLLSICIALLGY